jgi:DNA-binding transcriptional LysR family regulator
MTNWDLYRIFLAVADAGSLLTASKRLKLSAQTVSRRVAELEDGLGLKLLARSRVGHSLTPAGEQLRARIEGMGDVASNVETAMAKAKHTPAGVVRISINEVLSGPWLLGHLSSFYQEFPSLNLEIRVSGWPASVRRREADIVLRLFGPGEENLVGRRIGRVGVAIYCARSYARDHGLPASSAEWETHSSIGMVADIPLMSWFNSVAGTSRRVLQCSSHTDVVAAAKAGLGLAPLLCITKSGLAYTELLLYRDRGETNLATYETATGPDPATGHLRLHLIGCMDVAGPEIGDNGRDPLAIRFRPLQLVRNPGDALRVNRLGLVFGH